VPLIGINQGRLGFMTDIALDDKIEALRAILGGEYEAEDRNILQGTVERAGKVQLDTLALNDVVVSRGSIGGSSCCRSSCCLVSITCYFYPICWPNQWS
jgi:NAD+ kinase